MVVKFFRFASVSPESCLNRLSMNQLNWWRIGWLVSLVGWAGYAPGVRAQWLTQTIALKNGWNAVYLHVDPSHGVLDTQVGAVSANPILEVWRWNPPAASQSTESPEALGASAEWVSWVRGGSANLLQRLTGNTAYLVRVGDGASTYSWAVQGRPLAPQTDWTISGLNFIGFPTVPTSPPKFDAFLAQAPELQSATPEIYAYVGGDLGTYNPNRIASPLLRFTSVNRGQAYWVRSGTTFNHYFGPVEVNLGGATALDFSDATSSRSVRLKNQTTNTLTVTIRLVASEPGPSGQTAITGVPPLLMRGAMNLSTLKYGYSTLAANGTVTQVLAPVGQSGSEADVVVGLNRYALGGSVGALYAGVLRFTDSLGFSQVDVPVSATVGSKAGLWAGNAVVGQVGQFLKTYQKDASGNLVTTNNGQYVSTGTNTALGSVPSPASLRLLVHNPTTGVAQLLPQVFFGVSATTNDVVTTVESVLHPSLLASARRMTAVHLPWQTDNAGWAFSGLLAQGATLTTTVENAYDNQASNPFLHTYHPDHDNVDATFKNLLPQGSESYTMSRAITLTVSPPSDDFTSLTSAGQTLTGSYAETVTLKGLGTASRSFQATGAFSLRRMSPIAVLTKTL